MSNNELIQPDVLVLSDLDDTLITTRRKALLSGAEDPLLIAENSQPERDTVSPPAMNKLFQVLLSRGVFIPVTGRTLDNAHRVLNDVPYPVLISHFGGHASLGNQSEAKTRARYEQFTQNWNAFAHRTRTEQQPELNRLFDLLSTINANHQNSDRVRSNLAPDGLINELVVKKERGNVTADIESAFTDYQTAVTDFINQHYGSLEASPYLTHQNGNNFSIYLRAISKKKCVLALLELYDLQNTLTLSAGDSHSDLGFMRQADFLITPSTSQLANGL